MPVFKVGDAVVLLADIPEQGLCKGQVGTVVVEFRKPRPAYETEFADARGRTMAQLALLPDQIRRHENDATRPRRLVRKSRNHERNKVQA